SVQSTIVVIVTCSTVVCSARCPWTTTRLAPAGERLSRLSLATTNGSGLVSVVAQRSWSPRREKPPVRRTRLRFELTRRRAASRAGPQEVSRGAGGDAHVVGPPTSDLSRWNEPATRATSLNRR